MGIRGMIESPTKRGIRSDAAGDGHYHASRGDRLHQGLDFICEPGQKVYCPIDNASFIRLARPYADDDRYSGIAVKNSHMEILLFYLSPFDDLAGKTLFQNTVIGHAQDITKKYNNPAMTPHIHIQIDSVDPMLFMGKEF